MLDEAVLTRYSLREKVEVARVRLSLDRLGTIDDIWTAYLEGARPEDVEEEIAELDELAVQLVKSMEVGRRAVARLLALLEATHEDEVDFALQRIAGRFPDVDRDVRERPPSFSRSTASGVSRSMPVPF